MPSDHSLHLAPSIPTTIDHRSMRLRLTITVEPLFAQHGNEGGEEGYGQTCVEYGQDMNVSGIRAVPLRKMGSGFVIETIGDDLEDGVAHFLIIRFELFLEVDNETSCDGREQTSLLPQKGESTPRLRWMGGDAHEDQRVTQVVIVFFRKVTVMFVGFASVLVIEFDARVATGHRRVRKERLQCLAYGILQTTNKMRGD